MRDQFDPMTLLRTNPSFAETKEYSVETEVRVHLARAHAIQRIQLRRAAEIGAVVVLSVTVCWLHWNGYALAAVAPAAVAFGVMVLLYTSWETDSLLIETFLADIADPQRDSERRAELDAVLDWKRAQQQRAPVAPVVRIESFVRDNGSTQPRTILDDLPGPLDKLQWFCRNILDSRATFSERAARAPDVGYTREQWATIRNVFIDRGWACWNHPGSVQQGVTLLAAGRSALRDIVKLAAPYELTPME